VITLEQQKEQMMGDSERLATVMVADGDEDSICLLKSILGLKGFNVLPAADGQEAVDLAIRWRPDLILIDLKLPIVSGFTAIRRIKKLASLRDTPIIAVSFSKHTSHSRLALAAGCVAHIKKPIEFDRLDALIDQFLPGHRWELASTLIH
jgi:CheY-like chemotaxis protein